jgi:hypothetical protein
MRSMAPIALIAALTPSIANAHVVRHSSIPQAYWGTWTTSSTTCSDAGKPAVVLAAKTYVSPAGNCTVESVSETPSEHGPTYSARLQCLAPAGGAQKKSVSNLIIRPDGADRISVGLGFDSLTPYQRCSAGGTAAKQ